MALQKLSIDDPRLAARPPSECGYYIMVALSIITLIGSIAATALLYQRLENYAFAVGGLGAFISLILFSARNSCTQTSLYRNEWYSNVDLHNYFSAVQEKNPNLVISKYDNCFESGLNSLIKTSPFQKPIAFSLLIGGNHWALVFIDHQKRTLEYYDPKVNYVKIDQIKASLTETLNSLNTKNPGAEPYQFVAKIHKRLQPDSYQCGPWIAYFLTKRLENPDFDFNQIENPDEVIATFRAQIAPKLESDRNYYRQVPIANLPKEEQWKAILEQPR